MINTIRKPQNGEVTPIMEDFITDLGEYALVDEMLVYDNVRIKVMDTSILNCLEAYIVNDLLKVHEEADHMPEGPMIEVNLLVRTIILYQDWDILVTKVYPNIVIFVTCVLTKDIMTISVIMLNKS